MVGRVDSNQQILDQSLPCFSTLSCFTGTNMSGLFGSSYLQHKCSCFTLHVSIVRLSVFTSYSSLIRSHPDVSSIFHCTQIYKYTNVPYQISVPAFLRARLVRVSQILRSYELHEVITNYPNSAHLPMYNMLQVLTLFNVGTFSAFNFIPAHNAI